MKTWVKRLLLSIAFLLIILIAVGGFQISRIGPAATGYTAKMIGSSVFVTGLSPEAAFADFPDNPVKGLLKIDVDYTHNTVTASLAGLAKRRAIYREGYGVTLLPQKGSFAHLPSETVTDTARSGDLDQLWPLGERVELANLPQTIDQRELETALDRAFAEPNPDLPRRTRAVIVVHAGQIVAERYGDGFDEKRLLLGWSMSKSITNALIGILVQQGRLDIHQPAPVPEWSLPSDARHAITVDQLLRMSSGLEFVEDYGDLTSDVVQMLYVQGDMAAFAAEKPQIYPPDSVWSYSSGTANIVSRIVRQRIGSLEDYIAFPYRYLFGPLGMQHTLFEPDAAGTFVGSSFVYASARDWARFGLLYLQDGVWQGQRILPEGWVEYSVRPTPNAPLGQYGAFLKLNAGESERPEKRRWPDLPADLYFADGHEGQHVVIIPSYDLVLVRLGMSQKRGAWSLHDFIADVLEAFPEPQ